MAKKRIWNTVEMECIAAGMNYKGYQNIFLVRKIKGDMVSEAGYALLKVFYQYEAIYAK